MDKETRECLLRIKDTIESWLKNGETPQRKEIESLRWGIDLFAFLAAPRIGWFEGPQPTIGNPICFEPGCKARRMDGLVNHAGAGFDPVWYCRNHVKTVTNADEEGKSQPIHIPGLPEFSLEARLQKAKEMSGRWNKYMEEVVNEANGGNRR